MKEFVCILCPNGCRLRAGFEPDGETFRVEGNSCPRGAAFARTELTAPVRTLTTTVRAVGGERPVLAVRTAGESPRAKLMEAMEAISRLTVRPPVRRGEVIVHNLLGAGIDLIATDDLAAVLQGGLKDVTPL